MGSVVVDHENTSGFDTRDDPPMVAIYTSAYPDDRVVLEEEVVLALVVDEPVRSFSQSGPA